MFSKAKILYKEILLNECTYCALVKYSIVQGFIFWLFYLRAPLQHKIGLSVEGPFCSSHADLSSFELKKPTFGAFRWRQKAHS
jgi:hypothetical protein